MKQHSGASRVRSIVAGTFTIVLALCLWLFILPPQLGGRTTFYVTHGVSMEPGIHAGDLAILQTSENYHVGDVIAYRAPSVNNSVLLHRIIAQDGNRFTLQGDNNNFIDVDQPTKRQVVGKMVRHVADMGSPLATLNTLPVRIIAFVLIFLALSIGWRSRNDGRSEKTTASPSQSTTRRLRKSRRFSTSALLPVAAAFTAFWMVVSGVAFTKPLHSETSSTIYNLVGHFGYSGEARNGNVIFPDGRVKTGDPVYLSMTNELMVSFNYQWDSSAKFRGGGTIAMDAAVKGKTGWTHIIPLVPETSFEGDHAEASALVDLNQVRSVVDQVQALTRIKDKGFTLSIRPRVQLNGKVGPSPFMRSFAPELEFVGDEALLQYQKGSGAPTSPQPVKPEAGDTVATILRGLDPTTGGMLSFENSSVTTQLKALGFSVGLMTVRIVSAGAALAGLVFTGIEIWRLYRRRDGIDEQEDLHGLGRHADLIMSIDGYAAAGTFDEIVDVDDLDALVAVARQSSSLILHESRSGSDTYLVNSAGTTYRWTHDATPSEERFGTTTQEVTQ